MDDGHVEECPLGKREIGDRVPMVEALHVRPVLLGIDRPALGDTKRHLAVERLREGLIEITLVTGDSRAIGEGDSDRREFHGRAHRLDEGGAEIEETRPFSRVLGRRRLPVGAVDEGVRTIPEQPTFRNLGGVQLLAHHGLDGISPERNHRTELDRPCVRHASSSSIAQLGGATSNVRPRGIPYLPGCSGPIKPAGAWSARDSVPTRCRHIPKGAPANVVPPDFDGSSAWRSLHTPPARETRGYRRLRKWPRGRRMAPAPALPLDRRTAAATPRRRWPPWDSA